VTGVLPHSRLVGNKQVPAKLASTQLGTVDCSQNPQLRSSQSSGEQTCSSGQAFELRLPPTWPQSL
jgi:hypothetical protein